MQITYKHNVEIAIEEAIELYQRSTLGERRPIDRLDIFEGMLKNADVTISAWHGDRLVGISRALTDFTYVAYLADLAVDQDYQKRGIGKHLIEETQKQLAKECMLVLIAAPQANEYYSKIGFQHHPRAWVLPGVSE